MSRFSVKKPLTVFVGVVLILVLGIVSFTGMSTDLLPNMNLPYVIAVTTYPGASPEKVEKSVSKPIESELATTNGVKNITSVSNENVSMVVLEFEQDTNMDTAMIELSTAINTVSSQFDDAVGTPSLIKMSPDLLPIMVGGIDKEGLSEQELSDFINESIIPELEKVDGVASVEASGIIEKKISVNLNADKIESINNELLKTVNKDLYKAKKQIDDGLAEIKKGETKVESAQKSLNKKSSGAAAALASASAKVDAATAAVAALESQSTVVTANKSALEAELAAMEKLDDSKEALESIASGVVSADFYAKMPQTVTPTDEQQALIAALQQDMQTALKDSSGYIKDNLTDEQFKTLFSQVLSSAGGNVGDDLKNMSKSEFLNAYKSAQGAQSRISEIDSELKNLATKQAALDAMKPELTKNSKKAQSAYENLEKQKISAVTGLSNGEIQLSETRQKLESSKSQLESAKKEYETARDSALKSANLSGNLTPETVSQILTAQNFTMPAGSIEEKGLESHVVKVDGEYTSLKEIKNTVLMHVGKGSIDDIKLKDIADVSFDDNSGENYAKINSNQAVIFTVQKQSTVSTSDVSDAFGDKIKSLQNQYEGLSITSLMDQGTYIHMVINSVLENLIWGGLLAVLVLALFLRDIKPTVIIAFSIPISLLFAIVLMYFTDVTMNIISMSGLALGVGMLVDNSIVVIENIYRLRNQGVSAARAAVMGAKEVAGAITASTLTTVCVFVPIVFTQGMTREIFADMGLTIGYSLVASLLVALTVVPAMGSRIFKDNKKEKQHKLFGAFVNGYEKMLGVTLRHKVPVILLAVALLGVSVFGATRMGTAFIPESEQSQLQASIEFPPDYTKLETRNAADEVVKKIQAIDGIKTVGIMEASSGSLSSLSGSSSANSMTCYIELDKTGEGINAKIENQIVAITDKYGCDTTVSGSSSSMMSLGESGVKINIKGDELEKIYDIADDLALKLKGVEGLGNISNGRDSADTQTVISVDKSKAMKYNLTVAQVYQSIAAALSGETESATVTLDGEDYPIVIKDSSAAVTDKNLMKQKISYTDSSGESKKVMLGDIATNSEAESPDSIMHENSQRTLSVTAEVDSEHNIGIVSRDVEKILADYELPDGYTATIEGENETITEAFGDMYLMLLLALIFIYLIMVAQFQSFISPFIVIFTIPLAVTGGLLGLWITQSELSVVALIGFLILLGVVVNNGIVFVDYTNKLRERGMSKREALLQTGRTRIRPILMTALTTILAMTTMALGIGEGADMTAPLGIVVIGGLLYATILTLFIVPVMYDLIGKKKIKVIDVDSDDLENSDEDYSYDK